MLKFSPKLKKSIIFFIVFILILVSLQIAMGHCYGKLSERVVIKYFSTGEFRENGIVPKVEEIVYNHKKNEYTAKVDCDGDERYITWTFDGYQAILKGKHK